MTDETRLLAWTLASKLLEENHFLTLQDTDEILRYEDGVYMSGGEAFVKKTVEQKLEQKEQVTSNLANEVLGHVRRTTYAPRSIFDEANPHLVLENCLLNLNTMEAEEFRHDYYALNKIHVTYEPSAQCPNFFKFLNEILSPEDVQGVQEELGAILRKKYLTKKLSIYNGETDTGKSTLLNVILTFLGQENVSSVPLQELSTKNRFSLAQLYGKMANIADELPNEVIQSIDRIKDLTGGFQVNGQHKFQKPFDFVNTAYLISACNELPPVEQDDAAFWNRVNLRNFTRKFGGKEKGDDPEELLARLTTPEELSGILNFALEGMIRLMQNRWRFSNNVTIEETRVTYKRRSDPIWAFVEDRLDSSDSEAYEGKEDLYNSFKTYCESNKLPNPGKDFFYKHLGDRVTITSGRRGEKGSQKHCFVGVRLKDGSSGSQGSQGPTDLNAGKQATLEHGSSPPSAGT